MDEKECKAWINEVNWDMVHEDAVTMYLEWGNNNFRETITTPVRSGEEYSIYFVVNTWNEPKIVLQKMNNYGAQTLCEKVLPPELAASFMKEVGGLRGIFPLNEELKTWLMREIESKES